MKELLLDTSIIIQDPRILGLDPEKYKLLTTQSVIDEIRQSGNQSNISYLNRLKLLETGISNKNISIVPSDIKEVQALETIQYSINSPRLSNTEKNLLAYILLKRIDKINIYLVTKERLFKKFAASYNIEILDSSELDNSLDAVEKTSDDPKDIYTQIENYEKKERSKIFSGFFIGFLLSFIAFEIYANITLILASTSVWGTITLIILLSFVLYIIREKWRLPYGLLEFSVGAFSIFILFSNSRFNFNTIQFDSNLFIKIIGGLYIMVRGIDNVMIALKDTKFGLSFKQVFDLEK